MHASIFALNCETWVRAGFIVRNSNRELLLASGVKIAYNLHVMVVELRSLLWSFPACHREVVYVTEVEIDYMHVVNSIKGKQFNGDMRHVNYNYCSVLSQLNCSSIEHCRREGNMVAYEIAKLVKALRLDQVLWREFSTLPNSVQHAIRNDSIM